MQQLQRTTSNEFIRDKRAKFFGRHVQQSFVQDMRSLFAVERDNHGVQMVVIVDAMTEGTKGKLAARAEGIEHCAFGGYSIFGIGAVESADGGEDGGVPRGVLGV